MLRTNGKCFAVVCLVFRKVYLAHVSPTTKGKRAMRLGLKLGLELGLGLVHELGLV